MPSEELDVKFLKIRRKEVEIRKERENRNLLLADLDEN
jgi:hypothetical protein